MNKSTKSLAVSKKAVIYEESLKDRSLTVDNEIKDIQQKLRENKHY
jgi:hypothetical protein